MTRTLLAFITACALFTGCGHTSHVRENKVYKAEMKWFTQAAVEQAELLEGFIQEHCSCVDGKFTTPECTKAAKIALAAEIRAPYHQAMGLFNAGLSKERPPKDPPAIPEASTLCPEED